MAVPSNSTATTASSSSSKTPKTAPASTSMSTQALLPRRGRNPLSPNTVLNRSALEQALEDVGLFVPLHHGDDDGGCGGGGGGGGCSNENNDASNISSSSNNNNNGSGSGSNKSKMKGRVKPKQIDAFYQSLHRMNYPDIPTFVRQYYKYESHVKTPESMMNAPWQYDKDDNDEINGNDDVNVVQLPHISKNAITSRKNKNRQQLPRSFLEFLWKSSQYSEGEKNEEEDAPPPSSLYPKFCTLTSRIVSAQTSKDGSTTKLAVQLQDGHLVESVIMRYDYNKRVSLCVSSQVGCAMKCTFCATGTMGWRGNLTPGEILEQVIHANQLLAKEYYEAKAAKAKSLIPVRTNDNNSKPDSALLKDAFYDDDKGLYMVRNIVFMGMGEPLDNYNAVIEACRALMDRRRFSLSTERITVSTVGIVSKMRQLTNDLPQVSIALSLHAPNQEMRTRIVPTAKRYPIEDIIDALDNHTLSYIKKSKSGVKNDNNNKEFPSATELSVRRRAMIEYVMLEGETSSFECAHQLGRLCKDRLVCVNLIPYNKTDADDSLRCPSMEHMYEFQRIVISYGTFCSIRRTMGADIDSACGQLVTLKERQKQLERAGVGPVVDIEDAATAQKQSLKGASKGKVTTKSSKRASASSVSNSVDAKAADGKHIPSVSKSKAEINDSPRSQSVEKWIQPLAMATAVAAFSFLVTTAMYVSRRRR